MKRICLGKIVAVHGVRGLVKILPFGEDPQLLESLSPLYTGEQGDRTLDITLKNPLGKYYLAEVGGIKDRTTAETLRGTELYINQDRLPALEKEGAYYHRDLVGLRALGEQGEEIGLVTAVENFGAGDLLEIKPVAGKAFLLPFGKDYTSNVDLKHRTLRIRDFEAFQELVR